MSRPFSILLLVFAAFVMACTTAPAPVAPRPAPADAKPKRAEIRFASAAEGRDLLGAEDDFTRMLGGFDRSLRMKRTDAVADAEYRRFAGEQAIDFSEQDRAAWGPALEELKRGIEGFDLGLPPLVLIVKTTGREELNAAYTRRHAIMLPAKMIASFESASRVSLLAHELFHVSSRASQPLRDRRYALLGFSPMPAISPPREIEAMRLTNPDAHGLDHYVNVATSDGTEHAVVPLLTCAIALEKALSTEAWFKSINVVLVEVDPQKGVVLGMFDATATDWARRLGKNTGYVIHPEEVLADNFALIVKRKLGQPVKAAQPEFLDVFERALLVSSRL